MMMNFEELVNRSGVDFGEMDSRFFLIGLLSAFDNSYQAKADSFFTEISWKQFFAIICINLCKESPTLKQLADIMGSTHQNVKQILNKLEKKGYIEIVPDQEDKRKQRILLTQKTAQFCNEHEEESNRIVGKIFEGIDVEDINRVIRTMAQMEKNLEEIEC